MRTAVRIKVMVSHLAVMSVMLAVGLWTQQAIAVPSLSLPDFAQMDVAFNGTGGLWYLTLTGFVPPPGQYHITEGTAYDGWCADLHTDIAMAPLPLYTVRLYSSYDPAIPSSFLPNTSKGGSWEVINYIINQKQYAAPAIQYAVWYFLNGLAYDNIDLVNAGAQPLVDDALLNGAGFQPQYGDVMAVLLDPYDRAYGAPLYGTEDDVQRTFIEVNAPPVPEGSTLLLFGSGLSGLLFFARKKGLLKF